MSETAHSVRVCEVCVVEAPTNVGDACVGCGEFADEILEVVDYVPAEQLQGAVDRGLALRRAISVALANLSPGITAHMVLAEAAALYDHPGG